MTAARLGMSMTLAGLEPASFASEGDASLITPWGLVKPKPLKTRVEHMRTPVVEPGPQAWEACMMPLHYMRSASLVGRTDYYYNAFGWAQEISLKINLIASRFLTIKYITSGGRVCHMQK